MTPAADLRAEAERLARQLPALSLRAEASEAAHIGSAGRRRAGNGETFWQYRRYAQEDDAGRIHWRRSAKGTELFVRETELETARTVLFWADPHPGFHWKGEGDLRTKAEDAVILMLALAILMSRDGERIGALGSGRKPSFGKRAIDRLGGDLTAGTTRGFPAVPRAPAFVILASDFYDPVSEWRARLAPLASRCREGVLLAVSAPAEIAFPFEGRTRFSRPGTPLEKIIGRAETLREDYQDSFRRQREGLAALAEQLGWGFTSHTAGAPLVESAARLKAAIERFGATR
jgi:uncharacterized protein (DUF58 family)